MSEFAVKSLNADDEHAQVFVDFAHNRTVQLQKWFEKLDDAHV